MRRLSLLAALLALTIVGQAIASAQDSPAPGGRFFDDNETVHEPNIEAIAALGITAGCVQEGTAYCPESDVTRAQMATFIARALNLDARSNTYTDVNPLSVHAGNIAAIRAAGITIGCDASGSRFCPYDAVSRAQMASFLVRALGLTPRSSGPFTDISGTHAANINAIAVAQITLGCGSDGTAFCPDRSVTRGQMASFLGRGLDLDPVILPARVRLTAAQSVCTGSTPVCSGTSGGPDAGEFYIQEGWFYELPYSSGDSNRFENAEFRLYIDDERITDLVTVPTTDLYGTIVALEGYFVTGLSPGAHSVVGEWWWGGEAAFTSVIVLNVAG